MYFSTQKYSMKSSPKSSKIKAKIGCPWETWSRNFSPQNLSPKIRLSNRNFQNISARTTYQRRQQPFPCAFRASPRAFHLNWIYVMCWTGPLFWLWKGYLERGVKSKIFTTFQVQFLLVYYPLLTGPYTVRFQNNGHLLKRSQHFFIFIWVRSLKASF